MSSTGPALSILYRGPLSSCNYHCDYCPFAKHESPPEELKDDELGLARFVDWVSSAERQISVLFTPWGEGLVRPWYREAMLTLSAMPHVRRVAIQTNLSAPVDWLEKADRQKIALWATYHPTQTPYEKFLAKCRRLAAMNVRYSVGLVGLVENLAVAQRLRAELPDGVYFWINAFKSAGPSYYPSEVEAAYAELDPHFVVNNQSHPSLGRTCRTGASVLSVDGDGNLRRCHFVKTVLGNLYRDELSSILRERPCPEQTCGCFIGYVHLDALSLYREFGDGVLERIKTPSSREDPHGAC